MLHRSAKTNFSGLDSFHYFNQRVNLIAISMKPNIQHIHSDSRNIALY